MDKVTDTRCEALSQPDNPCIISLTQSLTEVSAEPGVACHSATTIKLQLAIGIQFCYDPPLVDKCLSIIT